MTQITRRKPASVLNNQEPIAFARWASFYQYEQDPAAAVRLTMCVPAAFNGELQIEIQECRETKKWDRKLRPCTRIALDREDAITMLEKMLAELKSWQPIAEPKAA